MSSITAQSSHIAWLMARLANKRNHILGLLQRLTGLGSGGSGEPVLFAQFTRWLGEVASAKNEEMDLMTRIDRIERKHCFLRLSRKLKPAAPKREKADDYSYCNDNAERPTHSFMWLLLLWCLFAQQKTNQNKQHPFADDGGLIWLVMFWYLVMRPRINQKKHGLTAD